MEKENRMLRGHLKKETQHSERYIVREQNLSDPNILFINSLDLSVEEEMERHKRL